MYSLIFVKIDIYKKWNLIKNEPHGIILTRNYTHLHFTNRKTKCILYKCVLIPWASLGAIHKGRPHLRGEGQGGLLKADAGGRGGQWQ